MSELLSAELRVERGCDKGSETFTPPKEFWEYVGEELSRKV